MSDRVLIIAEAGVNHNGDLSIAKDLVYAAAEAGADIVKFQSFKAEKLVTKTAEKALYQKENSGADESQYQMLKKLELSEEMHFELVRCCEKAGIQFLSTAFESESLDFLSKNLKLSLYKIPSGEITNGPLIHQHAQTGSKIIMSTGMSNLVEIEDALAVIAHGYCAPDQTITSLNDCYDIYRTEEAKKLLMEKVILLHCTSNYPASDDSVNLRAMDRLHETFGLPVGYSDHTEGIVASIAAVARGARVIEKHFTLDKSLPGPDHLASIEPGELSELVTLCRRTSKMLGTDEKQATESEISTREVARKSLHAVAQISKGDVFSSRNIDALRPGTGISPMKYWEYLQNESDKEYQIGEMIK